MTDQYHQNVSEYYGKEIQHTSDLKFSCCVSTGLKHKWHGEILSKISPEVLDKYYGCGSPIPDALDGQVILDLGSGTGRDCFLCSVLAGQNGHVIGVDMTDEQLEVANHAISYHKTVFPNASSIEFRKGLIENLKDAGIEDNTIDVVISNCVVNLSNDKQAVFNEIYRVLKEGGEVHISDIFTNLPLGPKARENKVLVGECMGNAIDIQTFMKLMFDAGFSEIYPTEARYVPTPGVSPEIIDPSIDFYSVTFSAFKTSSKADYWGGHWVKYNGGIVHCENELDFDMAHKFPTGARIYVGKLMFETIKQSRYGKYFEFGLNQMDIPEKPEQKTFLQTVLDTKSSPAQCCCSAVLHPDFC